MNPGYLRVTCRHYCLSGDSYYFVEDLLLLFCAICWLSFSYSVVVCLPAVDYSVPIFDRSWITALPPAVLLARSFISFSKVASLNFSR